MFFKLFVLGSNTEEKILKAGFHAKSYEEHNVYRGTALEFTASLPKDYILNGCVWKKIDASDYNERICCLAKTPYLTLDELWDLLLYADQEDDRIGALVFMNKQYYNQLRQKYKALIELNDKISKTEKKALKLLSSLM